MSERLPRPFCGCTEVRNEQNTAFFTCDGCGTDGPLYSPKVVHFSLGNDAKEGWALRYGMNREETIGLIKGYMQQVRDGGDIDELSEAVADTIRSGRQILELFTGDKDVG